VKRLAIFDCDGTLVDSGATIYAALSETFRENGLTLPPPEVSRRVIGLSLIEAMAGLLPHAAPEQHVRLAEDYKRAFWRLRADGKVEEPLFDGVLELLDRLEDDGWLLAVATGKSDRGLKHCLEQHNIHARFVSLQTGTLPSRILRWCGRRLRMRGRLRKRRSSSVTRASTWRWRRPLELRRSARAGAIMVLKS
jgi:phosphoglycolate phosphatase